jgi:hypothetical protein
MGVSNQFQLTQNACFDELIPNGGDELIPIGVDKLIPMDVSDLFSRPRILSGQPNFAKKNKIWTKHYVVRPSYLATKLKT